MLGPVDTFAINLIRQLARLKSSYGKCNGSVWLQSVSKGSGKALASSPGIILWMERREVRDVFHLKDGPCRQRSSC